MNESPRETGPARKHSLARLFALNSQFMNADRAASAPAKPESGVSAGFARTFQDFASRSLREKPRA